VTVFEADMSDPPTLVKAFRGAEAVFAVTNFYDPRILENPLEEAKQGCAVADIAKETNVKLVLWSTVPSALLRTGARFNSPRLVENKFTVSQYLKYRQVPHIDVYLGFFFDNWVNFSSISNAQDGAIEIHQARLKYETKLGMVWCERDLGRTIVGILKNYRDKPEMLGKPIYCVGGQYCTKDVVEEIKRQTGCEARMVGTPTSGAKELDEMYDYYNEWGVYRDVQIPHPETTDLGLTFSSLSDFVREVALPYSKTLGKTGLDSKMLGLTVAVS
jgi:NmrA-like family